MAACVDRLSCRALMTKEIPVQVESILSARRSLLLRGSSSRAIEVTALPNHGEAEIMLATRKPRSPRSPTCRSLEVPYMVSLVPQLKSNCLGCINIKKDRVLLEQTKG